MSFDQEVHRIDYLVRLRRLAYPSFVLGLASAGLSIFWTLGGTALLDSVGGSIEALARTRSPSAVLLGTASSLAQLATALLALALVRPWGRRLPARLLLGANAVASAVLVAWGGVNVVAGSLALGGVIAPADGVEERALLWHVLVWDLWFLVWGAALGLATVGYRRAKADASGGRARRPAAGLH